MNQTRITHLMKPENLLQQLTPIPTQKCTLGCPILDGLLNGGIPCNSITELVAESGCGKTQISLQLLLTAQLPVSLGGLSSTSLYLYSESPFPLRRLHQLSSSFPTLKNPLDNILTHPLHSAHHLFDVLSQLDSFLLSSPIKLIVIDSIAALFRFEFENNPRDLKQRSGLFFKISSKLKEQARRFGLAVVVINQVVDVMDDSDGLRIGNSTCLYTSERKVSAALGVSWANCVNTRLFLSRNEERIDQEVIGDDCFATRTRRFIRVVFAPHLPDSYCEFVITREKVFGLGR
ncbi:DNA repair protein XRCC3 homolog [Lycium ferocissimum]|uniref:DNA repair protein XRCC3 homolog n=1 Tax=Lycium ferocissimum TaxID=112874 RepID=UPI00281575E0|nr:DNA repair protein XRCC3 homolog [Lycium ferocissimum]